MFPDSAPSLPTTGSQETSPPSNAAVGQPVGQPVGPTFSGEALAGLYQIAYQGFLRRCKARTSRLRTPPLRAQFLLVLRLFMFYRRDHPPRQVILSFLPLFLPFPLFHLPPSAIPRFHCRQLSRRHRALGAFLFRPSPPFLPRLLLLGKTLSAALATRPSPTSWPTKLRAANSWSWWTFCRTT